MRAGLPCPETADARHLQDILDELGQRQPTPRRVPSPEDLEALEHAMRQRPDPLGRVWVGAPRQPAGDAAALHAEPERLVRPWPQSLQHDGRGKGRGRPAQGHPVPVWGPSERRKGQRRAGKRDAGGSAGLGL
jgi:hypothetical protein